MSKDLVVDGKVLKIFTNEGGDRVFQDMGDLAFFVSNCSSNLANLLVVILAGLGADEGFLEGALKVANDLAFQLEQACALLVADAGGAT